MEDDSDFEDESEVHKPIGLQRIAAVDAEDEDVSLAPITKKALSISFAYFRNNSIWMTYCPPLVNLANIKNYWFLAYAFQLVSHVAFVLSINSSCPILPKIIGAKYPSYLTYHQWNRENIWHYPQTW